MASTDQSLAAQLIPISNLSGTAPRGSAGQTPRRRRQVPEMEDVILLPGQLAAAARAKRSPAQRLAYAVLDDAVSCIIRHRESPHRWEIAEFAEAWSWVLDDMREWPFAFANLCDFLDLDIAAVRHGLASSGPKDGAIVPARVPSTPASALPPLPRRRSRAVASPVNTSDAFQKQDARRDRLLPCNQLLAAIARHPSSNGLVVAPSA